MATKSGIGSIMPLKFSLFQIKKNLFLPGGDSIVTLQKVRNYWKMADRTGVISKIVGCGH
jgi:hypothetical protein